MSPVLPDDHCDSGSAPFLAQGWHLAKIMGQIVHHAYEEESACPSSMLATRSAELLDMLCAHYRKLSQAELQFA